MKNETLNSNNKHISRLKKYSSISTELSCLSNTQILSLISKSEKLHSGTGGSSVLININEVPVFVKRIPLTDLEKRLGNFMSTANLFNLPLFFQYGVGSPGFGVWQELAVNIMTTNWVLSGECENFPLLYHWRLLDPLEDNTDIKNIEKLERNINYWENSESVRNRYESISDASSYIYLFVEHFPYTIFEWLSPKISENLINSEPLIISIEEQLNSINKFMNDNGLLHFDNHFENILTDGNSLYFSDFGLAISSKFDLSDEEKEFFERHNNYDYARAALDLLHCILSSVYKDDDWKLKLRNYSSSDKKDIPVSISDIIEKYKPVTIMMMNFFDKLRIESKKTAYPEKEFRDLLKEINLI